MKSVAIIMRSKNDAPYVGRTLGAFSLQGFKDFEVVSIDDSSSDGTRDIIDGSSSVRRISPPKGQYMPGRNMNFAVSACDAKVVVFNNADAIPVNADWLENLVYPILKGEADFTYARQVPRADADEWVRRDYAYAFGDKQCDVDFFSAASSAFSTEMFKKLKFDETSRYSEDVEFSALARKMGFRVAYVPEAIVEHSHNYTLDSARARFAGEGAAAAKIFGGKKFGVFPSRLRSLFGAWKSDFMWLLRAGRLGLYPRAVRFRWIQKNAFWSAYADALKKSKDA